MNKLVTLLILQQVWYIESLFLQSILVQHYYGTVQTYLLFTWVVVFSPPYRRVADTSVWGCSGQPSRSFAPPLVTRSGPRTQVEQKLFRFHTRWNKNCSRFHTGCSIKNISQFQTKFYLFSLSLSPKTKLSFWFSFESSLESLPIPAVFTFSGRLWQSALQMSIYVGPSWVHG